MIKEGYKETEIGTLPIDWAVRPIESVYDILDSQRIPVNETERRNRAGDIPYFGANGIVGYIDDYIFNDDLILVAEDGGNFEDFRIRPVAYVVRGRAWVNNHAHVLKPRVGNDFMWMFYVLQHKDMTPFIKGGTRAKLNQQDLRRILVQLPPLHEQQKIADILSTVDEHISETEDLIEHTKTLKQGMIQRLLTKGIGHTEFKETEIGRIPAVWKIGCMGESIKLLSGYPFSSEYFNETEEGIRIVRIRDINNPSTATYFSGTFDENFLLSDGDCIIGMDGDFNICKWQGGPALLNQRLCKVIEIPSGPRVDFVYHVMGKILSGIQAQTAATTVKHLSVKDINKALFPLPPLSEQRTIADILTTVDSQIDVYQTKLDALTRLKSGLMQQLLTGRIRVKV